MHPVLEAFFSSDLFGKGIFLFLLVLSILSWSLFLQKIALCRFVQKAAESFEPIKAQNPPTDPFSALYLTYLEGTGQKCEVERLLHCAQIQQRKLLEKGLFILPTVASLAPFLGLLGTVWGILLTFHELQLGVSVQANATVMGGLAMALGTTVVGLIVAIPALVSYNYLRAQIRHLCGDMVSFSETLLAKQKNHNG